MAMTSKGDIACGASNGLAFAPSDLSAPGTWYLKGKRIQAMKEIKPDLFLIATWNSHDLLLFNRSSATTSKLINPLGTCHYRHIATAERKIKDSESIIVYIGCNLGTVRLDESGLLSIVNQR